jgi:dTMP kinase
MTNRGLLIVFEGIDGSGKSTQIDKIYNFLSTQGFVTEKMKLVSKNTTFFNIIQHGLKHNTLDDQIYCDSIAIERTRSAIDRIIPLLNKGINVIVDRYIYTDLSYTKAKGCNTILVESLLNLIPKPDLVILTDLPAQDSLERILNRKDKPIWEFQENLPLLTKAREEYLGIAKEANFFVIDSFKTADENYNLITSKLESIVDDRLIKMN